MLRMLCVACLVLAYQTGWGQVLDGTYVPDLGRGVISFESESFQFTGNRFRYAYSSCTSGGYGNGTYTLTADTLRLRFEVPVSERPAQRGIDSRIEDGTVYTIVLRAAPPAGFIFNWPNRLYTQPIRYRRVSAKEAAKWGFEAN